MTEFKFGGTPWFCGLVLFGGVVDVCCWIFLALFRFLFVLFLVLSPFPLGSK